MNVKEAKAKAKLGHPQRKSTLSKVVSSMSKRSTSVSMQLSRTEVEGLLLKVVFGIEGLEVEKKKKKKR